MAKKSNASAPPVQIEQNNHRSQTRLNNPPIGLVDENESVGAAKRTYAYDPHIDPELKFDPQHVAIENLIEDALASNNIEQMRSALEDLKSRQAPYLAWAGKAERTTFDIPTVSLHTHEHIDARRVMQAVRKRGLGVQGDLFAQPDLPLGEALEFYKHAQNWQNRLIAGDSLLVMNSLLEKEAMAGGVQMIYFDPPYGIRYQSNFQPFTDKRDVIDGNDQDLSTEPEMIKAFRDTWQLGIHSYLTYLRDRLLLAKELLSESGSVFVQISEENIHRVKCLLDEIFGVDNAVVTIIFQKKAYQDSNSLAPVNDFFVWYSKNKEAFVKKFNRLYQVLEFDGDVGKYTKILSPSGEVFKSKSFEEEDLKEKIKKGWRLFRDDYPIVSQGPASEKQVFHFEGKPYEPTPGRHWSVKFPEGLENLVKAGRIRATENRLYGVVFWDENSLIPLNNIWTKLKGAADPVYVVQTTTEVVKRCILMSTSPGDLVLDITCGSGTTAYVAEQWGRRWITCDTSRVATAIAKQRLMTASFPYYILRSEIEGVAGDFEYQKVKQTTFENIAKNEPDPIFSLYNEPQKDPKRVRVCSPFTVEAVPSAVAVSPDETNLYLSDTAPETAANKLQALLDELMSKGIRGKSGQRIHFQNLEILATAAGDADLNISHVHARAEEHSDNGEAGALYAIVIGNEYTPMDKTWLDRAMTQAFNLRPKVQKVLFLAYQFDAGVHEYVEKSTWGGLGILLAQIDTDLLVEDLKKKQKGDSFWLIGQPCVKIQQISDGADKGKYKLEVRGFDYYNVAEQRMESGGKGDIAMWLLDTDYNGRFLHPAQIFFPMADGKSGWASLAKTLSAEIDPELIETYRGTMSLPFELGEHRQVAVKVIDKRGVESVRILKP